MRKLLWAYYSVLGCALLAATLANAQDKPPPANPQCCCAAFIRELEASCRFGPSAPGRMPECNLHLVRVDSTYERVLPISDVRCAVIAMPGTDDLTAIETRYCSGKDAEACSAVRIPPFREVRKSATWPADGVPRNENGRECCGDCCNTAESNAAPSPNQSSTAAQSGQ